MNNVYLYNGDFLYLLSLIKYLYNFKIKPDNIKDNSFSPSLFDNIINLNIVVDDNIVDSFINSIGANNFKIIFYTFLSNNINKELIIYYFYLNALKYKDNIIYMRNLKCVSESLKIAKYVKHEAHKYKGFVRFKELENNVLYAEIEPTNDVLYIISKHFELRLKNEYWIIKDIKRNKLSVYDKNKFFIISGDNFKLFNNNLSEEELDIEKLWKEFYKTIGIETRKNDRCRMNFMPKKYWKYIIEVSDKF